MKIDGKCAVIIGGAQGIGRAFVESILEKGATVFIGDIQEEKGQNTVAELNEKFGENRVFFGKCDITSESDIKAFFKEAVDKLDGPVEIFCSAAVVIHETNWRLSIDVNLVGTIAATYEALERMRTNKGGQGGAIVLISSIMGIQPTQTNPVYAAAKAGLINFARSWAGSTWDHGVRFNVVCPGLTDTAIIPSLTMPDRVLYPEIVERRIESDPWMMKPSDIARAFVMALEDEEMNGETLRVHLDLKLKDQAPALIKKTQFNGFFA